MTPRTRIGGYVVLSLAIHTAVLISWAPTPLVIAPTGHLLHIEMAADKDNQPVTAQPAPETGAIQAPDDPMRKSGKRKPRKPADTAKKQALESAGKQIAKTQPGDSAWSSLESAPTVNANSVNTALRQSDPTPQLRRSILELVSKRLTYPVIARRKGWQGTVKLEVHIEPDGLISRLRVSETSGYTILDRAAVKSLQLANVPHARQWLRGKAKDMVIPVEYRLLDS